MKPLIANAEGLLGISDLNPQGTATPLTATLTTTAEGQTVPLQLYLKPAEGGGWEIVDLTNPDKGSARTYEGSVRTGGRQADNVTGEAAKQLAIDRAWDNYVQNNPHPEGELVADFSLNKEAGSNIKQGHSNGISELGQVRQWASKVGLVTGAVGLGLLFVPGAQGAGALLLASAGAGAVAGGSNILDRTQHGNFQWDAQTFLDLTDIAAGLAVGAGSAIRVGAKSAQVSQLGKNTVLISEGVETGTDVAAGTIISAQHYRRIEEIRNSDLPEAQKQAQIKQELASAAATGGLLLIGGVATAKGGRARDFEFKPEGIATLSRGTKNSDELNKWRKIGLSETEIAELNNPNITSAQKDALLAKNDAVYKQLYEQFGEEGLGTLNQRLGVDAVGKVYQAGGQSSLRTVVDVIELEKQGKIRNFDDWASFFSEGNRTNTNVQDLLTELQEAKRVSRNIKDGEIVNIGGDARAVVRQSGEQEKSFDITIENSKTGQVTRNIEVKSVEKPVKTASDLTEGITHAIDKRPSATRGTVEATVQIDLASKAKKGKKTRIIDESGNYSDLERDGVSSYNTGNLFQDIKDKIVEIETKNQSKRKQNPNISLIDRVNITRKDGSLFATYIKENGEWKLKM